MKFGVMVSTGLTRPASAQTEADYVTRLALVGEEAGFDSVWCADRTVYPADLAARYPAQYGPESGGLDGQKVMTTLSFLAGRTSRVTVGFCVMVLPFRNPVLNANMVTTLDVLSGGRVIFGAGVGWMPEEFEAIGASYPDRGAQTDEHIEMFKALCADGVAEYHGDHFRVSDMTFFPKPLQKPHPPVWIGGRTGRAVRRAARLGPQRHDARAGGSRTRQAGLALRARGPQPRRRHDGDVPDSAPGPEQRQAVGTPEPSGSVQEMADLVGRYGDAGVEHMVISVAENGPDAASEAVTRFAE